jgi:hypothetical protein
VARRRAKREKKNLKEAAFLAANHRPSDAAPVVVCGRVDRANPDQKFRDRDWQKSWKKKRALQRANSNEKFLD